MIGKTISHYKILEKLGEGGMGVVYKAEDTKLKRTVALKFLPTALTKDDEARQRFIHEAQTASALEHPNICNIHEIDEVKPVTGESGDGQTFIVMACYEGEVLKDKIQKGPLKIDEAVDIAMQISHGLEKAHKKGIVHRDIKPANILITKDGMVKILDFGLAKLAGQIKLTKTGTTLGTVSYMSPEQAKGDRIDLQTDIWSLGVVLYEMLTGRLPFKGDYEQAVVYSILNEEPPLLTSLRKEIPTELEQIVLKILIKDKDIRSSSASEVCQTLTGFQMSFIRPDSGAFESKKIMQQIIRSKIMPVGIVTVIIISAVLFWLFHTRARVRWAKEIGVPEIRRLIEDRNLIPAFNLAQRVNRVIPEDSTLVELWPKISRTVTFQTVPSGADVYMKEYSATAKAWQYLSKTPIDSIRIPRGLFRWKIEKEGYSSIQDIHTGAGGSYRFTLDESGSLPDGMVRVPGGEHSVLIMGTGWMTVQLGDYLIDQYEVTNNQYKKFIDEGGYQNPEFWTYPFIKNGSEIGWEEGLAAFKDATGRPGPATWELGSYPVGQGDFPVGGVNWYEAAAYASFMGKRLPTYYHWRIAAATDYSEYIIPLSNFGEAGTMPVGSFAGLSYYGTYDMAGNVREWCNNSIGEKRSILGGAWDDPYYMFYLRDAKSPFDRSTGNGFRCIKILSPESTSEIAENPITISFRDYSHEKPVPDTIFKIFVSLYSYDKTDLNSVIEFVDERPQYWKMEKISYDAAYGNERMSAYLFLPKHAHPPYQTVIIFPGAGMFRRQSSEQGNNLHSWSIVDFILKSGRAVLYPIYKSAYERFDDYQYYRAYTQQSAFRDRVILWSKDLGRSIDYLETRSDIDHERLCYAGSSWGAAMAPILLAIESRIKVCYLVVGGFWLLKPPAEVDPIHFAPRVKIPVLMLNGRYDDLFPYETSQVPMFHALGTPDEHKQHRLFNVGHSYLKPRNEFIREVLTWLDRYLGPVN